MVSKSDVKYFKSASGSGFGRIIGSTEIISATPNNLFDDITPTELAAGRTEYRCLYIKNEHDTEEMQDVNVFMQSDNKNTPDAVAQWALDPISNGYPESSTLLFDGVNDTINFGLGLSLWSATLTKFSFIFWIFPLAAGDGNDRVVISHGGASNQGFRCIIDNADPTEIKFIIKNAAGANIEAQSHDLKLNAWNQIACVYDNSLGSANLKIYVDSVLGDITGNLTESIDLNVDLEFSEVSTDYKGHAAGFSWFTTKALSEAQIIRAFETDWIAEKEDPDAFYYFDEMTGSTVDDEAGSNNGTITGAVWADALETPNSTTAPVGVTWQGVTNAPVSNIPNIGTLKPNQSVPIWIKWTVTAGAEDVRDDYCIVVVDGRIPEDVTAPTEPNQGEKDPPVVPTTIPNFTLAHAGDWDGNSRTDSVVKLIKSWSPKVVLSAGDCAYECGEGDFYDAIKPIDDMQGSSIRFETCFGNHDNDESECSSNESSLKNHFKYSKTYHAFTYQNIRFIFIDNSGATDFSKGSAQYNFVKNDLETEAKKQGIYWKIIVCHVATWGADSNHDYNEEDFTEIYQPLFDTHKVDMVLAGHNHMWCQSEPAKYNSSSPTNPKVTQNGAGPYTKGNGTVVVINGTGGHDKVEDLYSAGSTSFTNYANNDHIGAGRIDISNNGKTLTYKFIDVDGSTEKTFVING